MKKFVCIHGHFYQPPRENPWTGEVDREESAQPFHDWNERIAKECYEANAKAPILNSKNEVIARVNNFANLSFDIGPTLLSWLRRRQPEIYRSILDADRQSVQDNGGHGNAMAQVYNHIIMPLASKRDKVTQVVWGIRDFEFHYKRKPEGMWLSETAVDRETLRILADHGVIYTVLAPHQVRRVRHTGFGTRWQFIHNAGVDTRHAYRVLLEGGKQFHVFFYNAPISQSIAFQGLLNDGEKLIHHLMSAYGSRDRQQLVSTATDGETFGHHHKFGEMAVAYALKKIKDQRLARVTNFAEFLEISGSYWEADVYDNSSWSCAHGVERWRSDCGCRLHYEGGWNQKWRSSLREAFDFLKNVVDKVYEEQTDAFVKNPWQARNDYIDVILKDSPEERRRFISKNVRRQPRPEEEKKFFDLLEAEKFALFMYTSCGWFFDEISGIEPVQVMKFALRALELVQPYWPKDLEAEFLRILAQAKSNLPAQGTGADVFRNLVKPARDVKQVA